MSDLKATFDDAPLTGSFCPKGDLRTNYRRFDLRSTAANSSQIAVIGHSTAEPHRFAVMQQAIPSYIELEAAERDLLGIMRKALTGQFKNLKRRPKDLKAVSH